jgi:tetratricopeptide (TPR) repeat protein
MSDWYDAEQRVERARELFEMEQWSEALAEIDAALEMNPYNAAWHCNRGYILDQMGQLEQAVHSFEEAARLEPNDKEALLALGMDLTRLNRCPEALEAFESLQHADPAFEPSYCQRIVTYTQIGQHDRAEEMFYLAQHLNDACPDCFYNIGKSLLARDLQDKAVYCFKRCLELDTEYPDVRRTLARIYRHRSDIETAREFYLAELRMDPGDVDLLGEMGEMFVEAGQNAAAAEKFRQMIELEPDAPAGHAMSARVAMLQGRWDQAIDSLETVLNLDSNWENVHGLYGEALLHVGRFADAKLQFEVQLFGRADDDAAMMGLGVALRELGKPQQASHCFAKVMARRPDDPSACFQMAICLFLQGKFHAGIALCLRTIQMDPHHLHALQKLVLAYSHLGRWSQARKVLDYGLRAHPLDPTLSSLKRRWWYDKALWVFHRTGTTLASWLHK